MAAPLGYKNGKPDIAWWDDQLKAGIKFREENTSFERWDTWRKMYKNDYTTATMPVNLFYAFLRSMVPRVYFKDPGVSITARKPGPEHVALATIMQRVDNKLIRQMKMKQTMKRATQNTFMFGTGCVKLGFGAQFTPTPEKGATIAPIENAETKIPWRTEYRAGVEANMPWVASVHTGNLIVPKDVAEYEEARWVCHHVSRALHDVQNDERLNKKARSQLQATKKVTTPSGTTVKGSHPSMPPGAELIEMVDLYEIKDMQTGKVLVLAPESLSEDYLFFEDDELQFLGSPNLFPMIFNQVDDVFWGLPDSVVLEPQQREMNEVRTQIMKHRRVSLVKMLVGKNSMTQEEIDKLLSEDVMAAVQISDIDAVKPMQISQIPQDLLQASQQIWEDVRQVFGFSKNQSGEFNSRRGDTSATEAAIVRQAAEVRLDERRDAMADLLTEVVTAMHKIIFDKWTEDQVIDVAGPDGRQIWVKFSGKVLAGGQYEIKIDPDNAVPESRESRQQKALVLYQQLKMNPLIDPIRLTSYLLHELQGVAFDDMLKQMDMLGAGSMQRPITSDDLGKVIGNASQQLPQMIAQMRAGAGGKSQQPQQPKPQQPVRAA